MTKEKGFILAARVISIIFTPFYLPLLSIGILFLFSYMNALPTWYKWRGLLMAYFFTILMPTLLIRAYRKVQGWSRTELAQKERRVIPYCISLFSYLLCIGVMEAQNIYFFIRIIIIAALVIQIVCVLTNLVWKISTHMAAIGALTGGILAFTQLFIYSPIWWFCLLIFLSGVLGTARMILRQHTLAQVVGGFFIGFVCASFTILGTHFFQVAGLIFRIFVNSIFKTSI